MLGDLLGTRSTRKARREAQRYISQAIAKERPYAEWGEEYLEDYQAMAYDPDKSKAYGQMLAAARSAIRGFGGAIGGKNLAMMGTNLGYDMPRLFAAVRGSLQQSYGLPVQMGASAAANISQMYSQGSQIVAQGYMHEGSLRGKTGMAIGEAIGKAFSYGQFSTGGG